MSKKPTNERGSSAVIPENERYDRGCYNLLIWMMMFLLITTSVLALGIRPAKSDFSIEEGRTYREQFWVVNNEEREFTAKLSVQGELSQYITLHTEELTFRGDEEALPVEFSINLPEEVPPGRSTADIVVKEVLGGSGQNVVSSILLLRHKIIVEGPYPDKYIAAKLNFYEQKDKVRLVAEVENLGKKAIGSLQTQFYVNDLKQQQHVLKTEETSLSADQKTLLEASLDKNNFEQGEFEVAAVTTYDDQKLETVQVLRVGQPEVKVAYFNDFFIANKINQYSLDLLNNWNQKVKDVFVDVNVQKNNRQMDEFRTKSIDIAELVTERINDYYNGKDRDAGQYSFDLKVNFRDSVQRYELPAGKFPVEFITETEFEQLPVAGSATGIFGTVSIVLLIVFTALLASAGMAYLFWRKKQSKELP